QNHRPPVMPAYKLYYFPVRALGEAIRQTFKLAEVEFEDVRVPAEEWAALKDKTPFGQMPVLEVDGKQIPQSFAIARYVASQHGLAGKTPFEAAWVDALADQWKDFQNEFRNYWYLLMGFREGDAEAAKTEHGIPARDKFYPIIVKQLKEAGSGFLVGDSATWVDLLLADQTAAIKKEVPGFLDAYPEVLAHSDKVRAIPQIAKWIETRPESRFHPNFAPELPEHSQYSLFPEPTMPEYKLYYFPIRGLGEVPRQILALADVKFENVGITKEQWPEFKSKTPFGQMPVLEVDGKQIPQSFAIARYVASQHGLAGKTPFEAAWVDALADQYKDFNNDFKKFFYLVLGFGEGDLEAAKLEHGIPARDKFFPLVVKQLKSNGTGFLVGDSVTWVDVLYAEGSSRVAHEVPGFLDDYPEV
ncbi:hypothetical protein PFISCL1PPCAC_4927, partial [Pristionchus fissidentatus]